MSQTRPLLQICSSPVLLNLVNGTISYLGAVLVNSAFLRPLLLHPEHSCGQQFPNGLPSSHCLSPSPGSGLSPGLLQQPPYRWPGIQTIPLWTLSSTSLQWLLTVSSKAESKFPNVVLYHLVLVYSSVSCPATHQPHLLPNHTGHYLISKTLFLLSPCLNEHHPLSVMGLTKPLPQLFLTLCPRMPDTDPQGRTTVMRPWPSRLGAT